MIAAGVVSSRADAQSLAWATADLESGWLGRPRSGAGHVRHGDVPQMPIGARMIVSDRTERRREGDAGRDALLGSHADGRRARGVRDRRGVTHAALNADQPARLSTPLTHGPSLTAWWLPSSGRLTFPPTEPVRDQLAGRLIAARDDGFVGRDRELDLLSAALTGTSDVRVMFVHGPGGIGKTTLLDAMAPAHAWRWSARDVPGRA